ncbi:signal peptidase I [Glutamicibacter arilaitensis]|uniref:signal peptidase I n=1 Tax=Glutamicibacter arilaitensis TaxID=256701 RepID=UPI003FD5CA19
MKTKRRPWPLWASACTGLLIMLLVLSLFQAYVIKQYEVSSGSMEQTLSTGDRVLVDRDFGALYEPAAGDIVVFGATETWTNNVASPSKFRSIVKKFGDITGIGPSNTNAVVKRVIGVSGDTVACCNADGDLMRNSLPVSEPYIFEDYSFVPGVLDCTSKPRSVRCFAQIQVPPDSVFVLGDHRSLSSDSAYRCRGFATVPPDNCARFVNQKDIRGRVFATVWPMDNLVFHPQTPLTSSRP